MTDATDTPVAPRTAGSAWLGLAGWLALVFAAGAIGAFGSASAPAFYAELDRPPWAPPASVFGPVWTILYITMGVAAWLVWKRRGFAGARPALSLFVVQLMANALWSWLFFTIRNGALAFGEVIVLWSLIVATIVAFGRHHRGAAVLLVPYLAWVTFATFLTWSVWQRNPARF